METPRKLGFVLLGGATTGALIKEIRFINELAARGCECHVWWAFERNYQTELHPSVQQRWLFHHARYAS
ncbi:MAG: hypothetical protein KDA96_23115, partial [Planctomycetaceae bacterium]|nr:hypothetical protein [Planctomycetaceae bacterium]